MDIMVAVEVMIKLLGIMILGFFLCRKDILNEEVSKKLSWMVVNVTSPLLVISSVFEVTVTDRSMVWYVLAVGFFCYAAFIVAAFVLSRLLRVKKGMRGIYQHMLVFANTGFMGYPVLQSLYGTEAIFYASIYGIWFNLWVFTYGVAVVRSDNPKNAAEQGGFQWKHILNAGIVAAVFAMILFICQIKLPGTAVEFCGMVGNITTPLSMLIIGASLASVSFKQMIKEKDMYVLAGLRLFLIPLLLYGACTLLKVNPYITGIVTISAAMPAASMSVMMAKSYDGNTDFASKGVVFTTLLSVITLPIVIMLTGL